MSGQTFQCSPFGCQPLVIGGPQPIASAPPVPFGIALPPAHVAAPPPQDCLGEVKAIRVEGDVKVTRLESTNPAYSHIFCFRVYHQSDIEFSNMISEHNANYGSNSLKPGEWSMNTQGGLHVVRDKPEEDGSHAVYVAFHKAYGDGKVTIKTNRGEFTLEKFDVVPEPGAVPLQPINPTPKSIPNPALGPELIKEPPNPVIPTPPVEPLLPVQPNLPTPNPEPSIPVPTKAASLEQVQELTKRLEEASAKIAVLEAEVKRIRKASQDTAMVHLLSAGWKPEAESPLTLTIEGDKYSGEKNGGGRLYVRASDNGLQFGWKSYPLGTGPLEWHTLAAGWREKTYYTHFLADSNSESVGAIIKRQGIEPRHAALLDILASVNATR